VKFTEGLNLKAIYLPHTRWIRVEDPDVLSITVVMQNGQMAHTPWFLVKFQNAESVMYNAALVAGVQLYDEGDRSSTA